MIIGAHLSISRGYPAAAREAAKLNLDGFQYFTRNPRGGAVRHLADEEAAAFRRAREEAGLRAVIAHLPYTVNLGSSEPRLVEFAAQVVREDTERARRLGAELVVTHPGHFGSDGREAGLERVVRVLQEGLGEVEDGPAFCLETMAGQGHEIGGTLEELAAAIKVLEPVVRVGLCLDSAHLFAAGWDLRTWPGIDRLVERIDELVGWDRVRALHLNDTKAALGSHRDRHELIGRGQLGRDGIKAIVTHPALGRLPLFLETPVGDYKEYAAEAALVRELAGLTKTETKE
ncbi:MAG: deoxyribonuclease [Bacillota bacterium]|nr:deoxyribonuclease [Bacillota bacterium]